MGMGVSVGQGGMDGASRTELMTGLCITGAANLADEYQISRNGVLYGDWFLPSRAELNQMFNNRVAIGGFTNWATAYQYYWSSTEIDAYFAWQQSFETGNQGGYEKFGIYSVRPIRSF